MEERAVKSITTPVAELAYLEDGPRDGVPVILAHGFPDDARTWEPVVEQVSAMPVRLLRPYQRGFGGSSLISEREAGGAQVAALAQDILDFADALEISKFILVGHDWGARAAFGAAILAPGRIRQLICLATPYGRGVQDRSWKLRQMEAFWYQFFFCTDEGANLLKSRSSELLRTFWRKWSPGFHLTDAQFDELSQSFDNAQFADTVIHYYRHRWKAAPGFLHYAMQQEILDAVPKVEVPTIFVCGEEDGANLAPCSRGLDEFFAGPYEYHEVNGVGHFVQRERPDLVASLIAASVEAKSKPGFSYKARLK